MSENERLTSIRTKMKKSQGEFAELLGIKQGSLSDIERGKVGVSRKIKTLLNQFLNVNIEYIETGKGEMFLNNCVQEPAPNYIKTTNNDLTHKDEIIRMQKQRIEEQNQYIEKQDKNIEDLRDHINSLKSKLELLEKQYEELKKNPQVARPSG